MKISRRGSLALFTGLMVASQVRAATAAARFGPAMPFSWDRLVAQAKARAMRPYAPRLASSAVAPDFDAAVRSAYAPAERLAGLVRLLPATRIAPATVGINIVEGGMARALLSTAGLFAGEAPSFAAGFRLLDPRLDTDWLSFLGASYFRAAGSQDQYGLSARGIAVDTGLGTREEFPDFTDFWIEQLSERRFLIHALLDGPSLAGAYAFDCAIGTGGVTQSVRAALFLRRDVERLGVAPATSMFWYGETDRSRGSDWRPEVHDSDGLAIWTGSGERIWRPLANPLWPRTGSFRADGIKGFGLIQRDRRFEDYQDDGAFYDRRPNLWIEPDGDWGAGAILLTELQTNNETADNVVAYWVSDRRARAGERRDIAYRLHWTSDDLSNDGAARVTDIWAGAAGVPGAPPVAGARKYVVDFAGAGLAGLDRGSGVVPVVNLARPALIALSAYPIARAPGRWRVMLDLRDDPANPKELRLYLRRGTTALSETLIEPLAA